MEKGKPAAADHSFHLYANRKKAHKRTYQEKKHYLSFFEGSVRGLSVGAPVLFKGIKLGQVLDVRLEFDVEKFKSQIPVLIELEPQRVRLVGGDYDALEKIAPMQRFVEEGLRAQLKSGSLITGQLYVELDFFDDAPAAEVRRQNGYPVIPSIASAQLEELTNQAARFMNTLNALPLREIGSDLRDTVKEVKGYHHFQGAETIHRGDRGHAPESRQNGAESGQRSGSSAGRGLERHPEALLKGKGGLR